MSYSDKEDFWEKDHRLFQESWDKSTDIKYIIRINWGGGLWENVIEVRKADHYGDEPTFWCDRDGNTVYEGDVTDFAHGHNFKGFDTREEAETFLAGAKFFRGFMCQFFVGKHYDDDE